MPATGRPGGGEGGTSRSGQAGNRTIHKLVKMTGNNYISSFFVSGLFLQNRKRHVGSFVQRNCCMFVNSVFRFLK
jgi:hypothetical protein